MTPESFATQLLASHPDAWPDRREEARAILTEWFAAAAGPVRLGLPAWLVKELPKTFPPE